MIGQSELQSSAQPRRANREPEAPDSSRVVGPSLNRWRFEKVASPNSAPKRKYRTRAVVKAVSSTPGAAWVSASLPEARCQCKWTPCRPKGGAGSDSVAVPARLRQPGRHKGPWRVQETGVARISPGVQSALHMQVSAIRSTGTLLVLAAAGQVFQAGQAVVCSLGYLRPLGRPTHAHRIS